VNNGAEDEVTKDMRRKAKVINFGIVYGMGVTALQANLGGSRKEAQLFYTSYFDRFPKISAYFDTVKEEAVRKGYTETLYGRRRYLPALKSHIPYIRAGAERMAMNAPIQGTAADMIKIAMRQVHELLSAKDLLPQVRLLLQIHDELIFEIEKEALADVVPLIRNAMEHIPDLDLTLKVDTEVGDNLGAMHPYSL
jgi:DNA polymerase-1